MAITAALAGLSILILGESHMIYGFPDDLHQDLFSQGAAQVHTVGVCGASAADWVKPEREFGCGAIKNNKEPTQQSAAHTRTQAISQLLSTYKPDVVMVIIGDTMGAYDNDSYPKAWAWQGISSLTKAIASTKTSCVWVGPAWGMAGGQYDKRDDRVLRAAKFESQNVSPCTFIDSLKFSSPGEWRTFDGQHFKPEGYKAWSQSIVGALAEVPAVKKLVERKQ